jgi:citrate-Mg2+:H+ or citrate-Ca2+:H+ symporter, CitMHS family
MLALLGYTMILVFVVLVMTRTMTALNALIIVPVIFGLLLGHGSSMDEMIVDGIRRVAPTGVMLIFSILFFGIMIDSGLFDPVVRVILKFVRNDPLRIALGTVALACTVALDGDGTSTFLITVTAMLPVYRRIGMSLYVLACLALLSLGVMNMLPWGGHTTRAIAALHLSSEQVFVPLVPVMVAGILYAFVAAYFLGMAERRRLGTITLPPVDAGQHFSLAAVNGEPHLLRPNRIWANAAVTAALLVALTSGAIPMVVLFMIGAALAIMINYPDPKLQKERIAAHAANVLATVSLLFASGIFTGVLSGTGMVEAMARALVEVVPESLGPQIPLITACVGMLFTYFMANDPYYFGVLPVIAEAAQAYGVRPAEIARAAVLGQPVHVLSPLFAALYLLVGLLGIDFVENQRFAMRWAIGSSLTMIAAAALFGVITV